MGAALKKVLISEEVLSRRDVLKYGRELTKLKKQAQNAKGRELLKLGREISRLKKILKPGSADDSAIPTETPTPENNTDTPTYNKLVKGEYNSLEFEEFAAKLQAAFDEVQNTAMLVDPCKRYVEIRLEQVMSGNISESVDHEGLLGEILESLSKRQSTLADEFALDVLDESRPGYKVNLMEEKDEDADEDDEDEEEIEESADSWIMNLMEEKQQSESKKDQFSKDKNNVDEDEVEDFNDEEDEDEIEESKSRDHFKYKSDSGKSFSVYVSTETYDWGTLLKLDNNGSVTYPLHEEEYSKIKNLKSGQSTKFRDESNRSVVVKRDGEWLTIKGAGSTALQVKYNDVFARLNRMIKEGFDEIEESNNSGLDAGKLGKSRGGWDARGLNEASQATRIRKQYGAKLEQLLKKMNSKPAQAAAKKLMSYNSAEWWIDNASMIKTVVSKSDTQKLEALLNDWLNGKRTKIFNNSLIGSSPSSFSKEIKEESEDSRAQARELLAEYSASTRLDMLDELLEQGLISAKQHEDILEAMSEDDEDEEEDDDDEEDIEESASADEDDDDDDDEDDEEIEESASADEDDDDEDEEDDEEIEESKSDEDEDEEEEDEEEEDEEDEDD